VKILHFLALTVMFLIVLGLGLWGGLALHFQVLAGYKWLFIGLWGILAALTLWGLCRPLGRARSLVTFAVGLAVLLTWWSYITPKLDRDWAPELAQSLTGEIDGNKVTLHNVRNFNWRTSTDFDARWEIREYDLDQLESIDMILSYWGDEAIAHTLLSFGFLNGDHAVFSVEIRRENAEEFSTIGGFFKKYELAILVADENDIVRLRTNVRDPLEDVYLYPITTTKEHRIALFKGLIGKANNLAKKPRFYHTIMANCTTVIYSLVRQYRDDIDLDMRIIQSGYLPDYMAERGVLNWSKPYGDIRARAAISAKGQGIVAGQGYSVVIRK
jgi:hypothetical protein